MAPIASGPVLTGLICTLAGNSTRMGQPKQHIEVGGKTFLAHIGDTVSALADQVSPRLFVGQPEDLRGRNTVERLGGQFIANHAVDLGPLHSIRLALPLLPEPLGFLLWPVDHPLVSRETIEALLRAIRQDPSRLIIPSDGQKRGHPSYFPAWARTALVAAPLEEGARWVVQRHPEKVFHVLVDDCWVFRNLNSPARLQEAIEFFSAATGKS